MRAKVLSVGVVTNSDNFKDVATGQLLERGYWVLDVAQRMGLSAALIYI
jgi:hypothetical protein